MKDPFEKIYNACNSGKMADKMANLIPFPRVVDIELTNTCNLKCKMCPTGMGRCERKPGFMSVDTAIRIISECSLHSTSIRFVRWGEPLLHPDLVKILSVATNYVPMVHINTNGMFLDSDIIYDILRLKIDSIKFSFQGTDGDTYEKWRKGGDFVQVLQGIHELYKRRGKGNYPFIRVGTTITNETTEQVDRFKEIMSQISDRVEVGRTRNIMGEPDGQCKYVNCPEVFDKLSINYDGTVTACCGDWNDYMVVGDVREESLSNIWTNEYITRFRQMLVDRKHNQLELCRRCGI